MTIGYVKVNAKPLRQALSTWASKWVYLFTHYLQASGKEVLAHPCGTGLPGKQSLYWYEPAFALLVLVVPCWLA